jgi:hypothetical protein
MVFGSLNILPTIFCNATFDVMEMLLAVFGDHGMTASGDHGGDSDQEIQVSKAPSPSFFLSLSLINS